MLAHNTLGGFPSTGATVRLSGITFAGIFDSTAQSLVLTSADIKYYQSALNTIGKSSLPPLVVDGKLGQKTYARIAEFQRTNNLTVTSSLDVATTRAITGQYFVARNADVKPSPVISSGERDNKIRELTLQMYDAIKSKRPDCKISLDGLSILCPEKGAVSPSATDLLADWLPGGAKANAVIAEILGTTKEVAKAGAKGFGQGFGATLPYAPLVYAGGAIVGIIILKKFLL